MNSKKWQIRNANDKMIGKEIGRWTVLSREGSKLKREPLYKCECLCGTIRNVGKYSLKFKKSVSCGCYQREQALKAITRHGMYGTKVYHAWSSIIQRCYNPNNKKFKIYGGRGIKMFMQWRKSFKEFYKYIGDPPTPRHTIERIEGNKGYFPGNIKWATYKEQGNNVSKNRLVLFKGKKITVSQLFDLLKEKNICHETLTYPAFLGRILSGISIEKSSSTPVIFKFAKTDNDKGRFRDIIGKKFNKLTVIKFSHYDKSRRSYFLCRCDCGNEKIIQSHSIVHSHTASCGCFRAEANRKGAIGQKFGYWTVIGITRNLKNDLVYVCRCKCGCEKEQYLDNLKRGKTLSCGCKFSKKSKKLLSPNAITE